MRVLFGNLYFYPALGGIENYILNVSREFIKLGHEVTIITSKFTPELAENETFEGINILRFDIARNNLFTNFFQPYYSDCNFRNSSRKLLLENNYDLIIARDVYSLNAFKKYTGDSVFLYIQATAVPLYMDYTRSSKGRNIFFQIAWSFQHFLTKAFLRRMEKLGMTSPKSICVLSQAKRNEISKFYNFDRSRFRIVPPGVNRSIFSPVDDFRKFELRSDFGFPIDKRIFLFVGRFEREKNPLGILKAMCLMKAQNAHFVFVGSHDVYFKQQIDANNLTNLVSLVGSFPEPSIYYQLADVFLLPSLTEGFGQVILEAMACSLPVIGFNNPESEYILANEEIIENQKTGILVKYEDYRAYANAIDFFSSDLVHCKVMGANALNQVKDKYSWERTAMLIQEIALE